MSSREHLRLLFVAAELPGQGGLSTSATSLYRGLRAMGTDVHYLTVLEPDEVGYDQESSDARIAGDPHGGPYRLIDSLDAPQPALRQTIMSIGADVGVGFGFRATLALKHTVPEVPVVFVTGTCRQAQDLVTSGRARDLQGLREALASGALLPNLVHNRERQAVEKCDLILTHTQSTLELFQQFFPVARGKLFSRCIEFSDWISDGATAWSHLARPFHERDIDVLFVASDWTRAEKGYDLVSAVTSRLGDLRIHVVGHVARPLNAVAHAGVLAHGEPLFALFGRARCVVCPSSMDAAPGILHEASVMGANAVASSNCGNAHQCHPRLLADPLEVETLLTCIRRAVAREWPDQLNTAGRREAVEELLRVVTALARPFTPQARP